MAKMPRRNVQMAKVKIRQMTMANRFGGNSPWRSGNLAISQFTAGRNTNHMAASRAARPPTCRATPCPDSRELA